MESPMSDSLFEQAFDEVARAIEAGQADLPESLKDGGPLQRLRHPDRVIRFTVRWMDDAGGIRHTPAWRVQYCNLLGPYKGGLRFAKDVSEDTLLFLAFEQCLKNALTGLPLGGGKGGAQFRVSDHSEHEVLRFCQSFMDEYARHGGEDVDIPAGDIGTGSREIGWLYGRYTKLTGRHVGSLTGKPEALGGIPGRTEATGYGAVQFARLMLEGIGAGLEDARVAISGAGNVALHAAERALADGATVLSLSNSEGTATFGSGGLTQDGLQEIKRAHDGGGRLEELGGEVDGLEFSEGGSPWELECDLAMPCATQNELQAEDAEKLVRSGVKAVVEGANMPCTHEAVEVLHGGGSLVGPGKAANAGGVVVSGFEMIQNSTRDPWSRERVLGRLDDAMGDIHRRCAEKGSGGERIDYVRGANLAGYERLGRAIVAAGPN